MIKKTFPVRKPNRLSGHDYSSPGWYYVTICVFEKNHLLGSYYQRRIQLKKGGEFCTSIWMELPQRFPDVELDEFVVMPNHVHGVLRLKPVPEGQQNSHLGNIMKAYKSLVAKEFREWYREVHHTYPPKLWQRSFHDKVIRNERSLIAVREYIQNNPINWGKDPLNLENDIPWE